jgi:hypothetical protein
MAENPLKALREATQRLRETGLRLERRTQHQLAAGRARLNSPEVKGLVEMGKKMGKIGKAVGKAGMAGLIYSGVSEALKAKKERERVKRGLTPEI